MNQAHRHVFWIIALTLVLPFFGFFANVQGATESDKVEELRKNIELKNSQIEKLNKEIKALDSQIQTTAKEGQTLKGALSVLETSRAKLLKEIEVTQGKVSAATLSIEGLGIEIKNREKQIAENRAALGDALRDMNQTESSSMVETVLKYKDFSELWNEIESLSRFQVGLKEKINAVEDLKRELSDKKSESEAHKQNLLGFQADLVDQKKVVEVNRNEKNKLLTETQSKEALYRQQLEEKKRLSEEFQQEINQFESQLRLIIDPSSYPPAGKGILRWPLAEVFVTQTFGETEFAKTTRAYNGKGHNGVDFRASPGTKVMSALGGVVEGTGNTDIVPGCYSYGKWVLVKHDNGLSTLYAHLSVISAEEGQRVNTGDTIGFSGNTGYSTGPHLHFGVYASQGVKILKYTNSINCKNAVIPVADVRAYLDPLVYL